MQPDTKRVVLQILWDLVVDSSNASDAADEEHMVLRALKEIEDTLTEMEK